MQIKTDLKFLFLPFAITFGERISAFRCGSCTFLHIGEFTEAAACAYDRKQGLDLPQLGKAGAPQKLTNYTIERDSCPDTGRKIRDVREQTGYWIFGVLDA